jgi:hypothetical protein
LAVDGEKGKIEKLDHMGIAQQQLLESSKIAFFFFDTAMTQHSRSHTFGQNFFTLSLSLPLDRIMGCN